MKKSIIISLVAVLMLSLSSCKDKSPAPANNTPPLSTPISKATEKNISATPSINTSKPINENDEDSKDKLSKELPKSTPIISKETPNNPKESLIPKNETMSPTVKNTPSKSTLAKSTPNKAITSSPTATKAIASNPTPNNSKASIIAKSENIISTKEAKELLEEIDAELDSSLGTVNNLYDIDESKLAE